MAVTVLVVGNVGQGPVVVAVPLGCGVCGELLPGPFGQPVGQCIGPHLGRPGGDPVIAGDLEDVADQADSQRARSCGLPP